MEQYRVSVTQYGNSVRELANFTGMIFAERSKEMEQLRLAARRAWLEMEEHQSTHGCLRKPVQNRQGPTDKEKTGS
jgi:hypothetical protein